MMKRCVESHQVLLGQRHLVSTAFTLLLRKKISQNENAFETLQRWAIVCMWQYQCAHYSETFKGDDFSFSILSVILGRSRLRFVSRKAVFGVACTVIYPANTPKTF